MASLGGLDRTGKWAGVSWSPGLVADAFEWVFAASARRQGRGDGASALPTLLVGDGCVTGSSRRLRNPVERPLFAAAVLVHVLAIWRPVDVLSPVDPGRVGRLLVTGHVPYVSFAFEYPPLAALGFLLPGLVPHTAAKLVLAVQAAALEGVVVWLLFRSRPGALRRYAVLSMLLFPILAGGFDAIPMATIAIATSLVVDRRATAWIVAALGAAAKLSPGVLLIWWRVRTRAAAVCAIAAGAILVVPLAMARHRDWDWITYNVDRGVQIESVPATTVWLVRGLLGHSSTYAYRFRSVEVDHARAAALLWAIVGITVLVWLVIRAPGNTWRTTLVALDVFLLSSKVLSPQYMVWTAPLAAVVGGPLFLAHLVMALLTVVAYAFTDSNAKLLAVIAARNLVLVATVGYGFLSLRGTGERVAGPADQQ